MPDRIGPPGHSQPSSRILPAAAFAAWMLAWSCGGAAPALAEPPSAIAPSAIAPSAITPAAGAGGGWLDTMLEPFEVLSRWVTGLFSHEERFVVDEIQAFKHDIDTDLTSFDGLVQQAGFGIGSVSVGASLVPDVSLTMEFHRRLSEPEKAALMARLSDPSSTIGTVERSIIMTLLNAAESAYAIRGDGYRLSEVDIDLDVIPNVTFVMTKTP